MSESFVQLILVKVILGVHSWLKKIRGNIVYICNIVKRKSKSSPKSEVERTYDYDLFLRLGLCLLYFANPPFEEEV